MRLSALLGLASAVFLVTAATQAVASPSPQEIQSTIAHANPARALEMLAPILKADPHGAVYWYLDAEALDAMGKDPAAKAALTKAELLAPRMPFANPKSLRALEHRVGLQNLRKKAEAEHTERVLLSALSILAFLILLALLLGSLFSFRKRNRRRSELAKQKQEIMLDITSFIRDTLEPQMLQAKIAEDSKILSACDQAKTTLVFALDQVRSMSLKTDLDEQEKIIASAGETLHWAKAKCAGKEYKTGRPFSVETEPVEQTKQTEQTEQSPIPTSNYPTPDVTSSYMTDNDQRIHTPAQRGFGDSLMQGIEQGIGVGIGMDLVEDLLGDNTTALDLNQGSGWSNTPTMEYSVDDGLTNGGGSSDDWLSGGGGGGYSSDDGLSGGYSADNGLSGGYSADDGLSGGYSADDGLSGGGYSSNDGF